MRISIACGIENHLLRISYLMPLISMQLYAFCLHFPTHFSAVSLSFRQIAFQRSSFASTVVRASKFHTKSCSKFDINSTLDSVLSTRTAIATIVMAAAYVTWVQICWIWHANCIQYRTSVYIYIFVSVCTKFCKNIVRKCFNLLVLVCLLLHFSYWLNSVTASNAKKNRKFKRKNWLNTWKLVATTKNM